MQNTRSWDYLIVTAANDQQGQSYERQLRQRERAGQLASVRRCLVVSDIEGRRIGSGGSTLHCLAQVLDCERSGDGVGSFEEAEAILRTLRILIVHAGGDSRRLPAYSHCGKMFVPVPDKLSPHIATTLFDRLVPAFLSLPEGRSGQVVIASGDALILFDPSTVDLTRPGITALGSRAPAHEAAAHGVFSVREDGLVTRYLQKPTVEEQLIAGALNDQNESVLDLGVMSCDAAAAVQLLRAFFSQSSRPDGRLVLSWKEDARSILLSHGIDLYREICCALGTETNLFQYAQGVRAGGVCLGEDLAFEWYHSLHDIPLRVSILRDSKFLHFGTTRQLITSGLALLKEDGGEATRASLVLNSDIQESIVGDHAWVEACSVEAPVRLEGFNAVVGVDVSEPLILAKGASVDLSPGLNRKGDDVWFLRYYDIDDSFKQTADQGGTFCGLPFRQWLHEMGRDASAVWEPDLLSHERTLWNAQVFPALTEHEEFRDWLWLLNVTSATFEQKNRFWAADRYSSSEIAVRVDQGRFHARRGALRSRKMPVEIGRTTPAGKNCSID